MAVEFALLMPVLALIRLGVIVFGLALNQYIMLWNGVGAWRQIPRSTGMWRS